jgi:glycosyltransferase involved in cell wall biosynthesis
MEIAVCIASFRREAGLRKLLESIVTQRGIDGRFGVIVVDNDPHGSARSVVEGFVGAAPEIRYVIEPEPGIPAARNRSIDEARSAGASFIAFIDDDEFATPYLLATMFHRIQTSGADAISGPVEPLFAESAPAWARSTRLYHRTTYPDGAELDYASTANSMLRLEAIAGIDAPFSIDFRFTGGSDTYLYQSIRARGKRIIWEPAALVYEDVPASRLSLQWMTTRSYRQGITLARCDLLLTNNWRKLITRATRGLVQFPLGSIEIAVSLIRKDDNWRRGLARIARGAGVLAGLAGATFNEYQRD